jgi:putative ABC transport system permease protein
LRKTDRNGVSCPAMGLSFRYALRLLGRQPAAAAVAIVTMALGIGATTMLFSVVDGVLLKPLPWADADRLVRVTEMRQGRTGRIAGTVSNGTFLAWREAHSTIEDIGGWLTRTSTLTGAGEPARVATIPVTPALFRILRAQPLVGRLFEEGERDRARVAILSYGLWQERFAASSDVLGRIVELDAVPYTVVGVMPREFAFPDREARLWTAWAVTPVVQESGAVAGVIFRAIARLREGVTPEQASAEATARARSAPDMGPAGVGLFGASGPIDITVVPELHALTADVRPAVLMLLAAVGLLLVTATANVASVQLARSTMRRREMAVRAAIGAGQRRIVMQVIVENAIVGVCGGVLGVALAAALLQVAPTLLPAGFPRLDAVGFDPRVLGFSTVVSLLASVGCGLLPAWHARRLNLVATLIEDGSAPTGGSWRSSTARTRAAIMIGQVAIACVLLIGAALLMRSLRSLIEADRGYDPTNVLTARLPLTADVPGERRVQLLDTVTERLRTVPGVTHAAYSTGLPFVSAGGFTAFKMRSPLVPDREIDVQATQRIVSPDYFGAMRLRLVSGRLLSEADTAVSPPAILVNRTFARQYLGERAVGSRIPQLGPRAGRLSFAAGRAEMEIVGVVDDMRQDSVDAAPQPEIYASFKQLTAEATRGFDPILVVRTSDDPVAHVPALRGIVREVAPNAALDSVMTMEDRVSQSLARPRLYARMLVWFGAFALLIAGVGLFGVLSFSVARRTREIGIRSALGADASDVVRLVVSQAVPIVALGLILGVGAALAGVRLLSPFLYGVHRYDGVTFLAVPLLVLVVALVACVVPARRAARLSAVTALRTP